MVYNSNYGVGLVSAQNAIREAIKTGKRTVVCVDNNLSAFSDLVGEIKKIDSEVNLKPVFGFKIVIRGIKIILVIRNEKGIKEVLNQSANTNKEDSLALIYSKNVIPVVSGIEKTDMETSDLVEVAKNLKEIFKPLSNRFFFFEPEVFDMNSKREREILKISLSLIGGKTLNPSIANIEESADINYITSVSDVRGDFSVIKQNKTLGDLENIENTLSVLGKYCSSLEDYSSIFPNKEKSMEFLFIRELCYEQGLDIIDNNDDVLKLLSIKLLESRLIDVDESLKSMYMNRLSFELKTIKNLGFSGYFLSVFDYVDNARNNPSQAVGPGRGSAVGSLVAFALKITNIDPLKNKLFFERFLNPERVSMPDIDVDFADKDLVFDFLSQKYSTANIERYYKEFYSGENIKLESGIRVAKLVSFESTQGKEFFEALCKHSPFNVLSEYQDLKKRDKNTSFKKLNFIFSSSSEDEFLDRLKTYLLQDISEELYFVFKNFSKVKFRKSYKIQKEEASIHASGVLISNSPLENVLPIVRRTIDKQRINVANIDPNLIESSYGLIKYDILGSKMLKAYSDIAKSVGISLDDIDLSDPSSFKVIGDGFTQNLYQISGKGFTSVAKVLKPKTVIEVSNLLALHRPGPMASGAEKEYMENTSKGLQNCSIDGISDEKMIKILIPILQETKLVVVYQEQVMEIVKELGGFTLAESDLVRRAMGKKTSMNHLRDKFIQGGFDFGFSKKDLSFIFDKLELFSQYCFNKSHSIAYATLTIQGAWLKANHPKEFFKKFLNVENKYTEKTFKQIQDEALHFGITLKKPNLREINYDFTTSKENKDEILFGFKHIVGFGERDVNELKLIVASKKPLNDLFNRSTNSFHNKSLNLFFEKFPSSFKRD